MKKNVKIILVLAVVIAAIIGMVVFNGTSGNVSKYLTMSEIEIAHTERQKEKKITFTHCDCGVMKKLPHEERMTAYEAGIFCTKICDETERDKISLTSSSPTPPPVE